MLFCCCLDVNCTESSSVQHRAEHVKTCRGNSSWLSGGSFIQRPSPFTLWAEWETRVKCSWLTPLMLILIKLLFKQRAANSSNTHKPRRRTTTAERRQRWTAAGRRIKSLCCWTLLIWPSALLPVSGFDVAVHTFRLVYIISTLTSIHFLDTYP